MICYFENDSGKVKKFFDIDFKFSDNAPDIIRHYKRKGCLDYPLKDCKKYIIDISVIVRSEYGTLYKNVCYDLSKESLENVKIFLSAIDCYFSLGKIEKSNGFFWLVYVTEMASFLKGRVFEINPMFFKVPFIRKDGMSIHDFLLRR